jgi:hypothetical protein
MIFDKSQLFPCPRMQSKVEGKTPDETQGTANVRASLESSLRGPKARGNPEGRRNRHPSSAFGVKKHWSAGVPPASWVFLAGGTPALHLKNTFITWVAAITMTANCPPPPFDNGASS